jgi:cysteine desulfurase/selenocysteine lyase
MNEERLKFTNWADIRGQFPVLSKSPLGDRLVYLDTAASSQAPYSVIEAMASYRSTIHSNVRRGVHTLSQKATDAFEDARGRVAAYIGAKSPDECIFVRGATEGINLVANSFVRPRLKLGSEILVTAMEHHSNIVPWQIAAKDTSSKLTVVPILPDGSLCLDSFDALIRRKPVIFAVTHISNVLGTLNPVKELVAIAHREGVPVLVDGCQAMAHVGVDVCDLDVDFYAFSAHKMYGPTGIGVLYGKRAFLESMPPFLGGGEMIVKVTFENSTFNEIPSRFEAGTPPISEAVGLGAAIRFLEKIPKESIQSKEHHLLNKAREGLKMLPYFEEYGTCSNKASILSFNINGLHHHDLGTILDSQGIAVRVGHMCAQPLMNNLGVEGCLRASFSFYNTDDDVEMFIKGVHEAHSLLTL